MFDIEKLFADYKQTALRLWYIYMEAQMSPKDEEKQKQLAKWKRRFNGIHREILECMTNEPDWEKEGLL